MGLHLFPEITETGKFCFYLKASERSGPQSTGTDRPAAPLRRTDRSRRRGAEQEPATTRTQCQATGRRRTAAGRRYGGCAAASSKGFDSGCKHERSDCPNKRIIDHSLIGTNRGATQGERHPEGGGCGRRSDDTQYGVVAAADRREPDNRAVVARAVARHATGCRHGREQS